MVRKRGRGERRGLKVTAGAGRVSLRERSFKHRYQGRCGEALARHAMTHVGGPLR